MNVANVATLDIPVATLILLEQAFSHVSQPELHSDDMQPEDSLKEPIEDLDIIYSLSFLKGTIKNGRR